MNFEETLKIESKKLGISLNEKCLQKFIEYKEYIQEYNKTANITSIDSDSEILYKHFIDSLTLYKFIEKKRSKCIDIGSGAGFPLVPLKLLSNEIEMTLLDSDNKKIDFLKNLTRKLDLRNTIFIHSRAEDAARTKEHRGKYDYALSRAVGPLSVLIEYSIPFLKTSGKMLAMKGAINEDAKLALKELRAEIEDIHEFEIRYGDEINKRMIITIIKKETTPDNYPRKAGIAKRNPL